MEIGAGREIFLPVEHVIRARLCKEGECGV
jgi:hypothetical protein